ncbi:hypothetical protein S40285_08923 [Stachybotrys chlorohalonatus IBT 40285]|uniref:EngB-type G domain-containing protein n=1 Tax=Stachybotrys chlorohalonatus (strain IBT 40285) TaxID=1283841 RepID=A0A084QKM5_STAC4|nr:hypothetical protein S40285_08923 [Stachybotrys chlorohalonata IBT 40285]
MISSRVTLHRLGLSCHYQTFIHRGAIPRTRSHPIGQRRQQRWKSYKQTIASSEMLRCRPESETLATKLTSVERQELASARKFFEEGYEFLYSAESFSQHSPNTQTPEIIVLGASNVGKSSFLNALIGRPNAARVSQKPGKTTMLNAFAVGPRPRLSDGLHDKGTSPPKHSLIVMDSPGYGYKSRSDWGHAVVEYIEKRSMLRGAVVLVSMEKKLLPEDRWILKTLAKFNTRTIVVVTKADKGGSHWATTCREQADVLRREMGELEQRLGNGWTKGSGWMPDIYVTAANMDNINKLGNGGGIGGVRLAILNMAGFNPKAEVEQKAEAVAYTGRIVSFDDICWKVAP